VKKHDWPGNVRQLHNVLVQAAVLAEGQVLDRSDLVAALGEMALGTHPNDPSFYRPLDEQFEPEEYLNTLRRNYLRRAMEQARGVKSQAARLLGMKSYQTLDAQLKRLQVSGEWDP
jgi:DNA-binding NtrC family response regulator